VAVVRYALSDELLGFISQDKAHARGDVEKGAFETENNNKVGGFFEEEHVQELVTIVSVRLVRGGCGWGDIDTRGEGDRGGEFGVCDQTAQIFA
jgi:hypothetical protein